jgi:hypothetical protein
MYKLESSESPLSTALCYLMDDLAEAAPRLRKSDARIIYPQLIHAISEMIHISGNKGELQRIRN